MKNIRKFLIPLILVAGVALTLCFARAEDPQSLITPSDAAKAIGKDSTMVILDVRTPAEFASETGHLAKAILIPVQDLEARAGELAKFKNQTILVYCRSGHRSTAGTEILLKKGFKALNMAGGITRWRTENLPVVKEAQ